MADEAFALSPISARAAQPREEDYDAISEAFMETSRGRWFLGEYARRNRNADTHMVLDAVARIEQTLAAQKQKGSQSGLAEALATVGRAVDGARAAASATLDNLALEETLAPIRKGARVIKEIAWRWREIGADGRICDLIDSQVSAIESACGRVSSTDLRAALSAAFDLIAERIEQQLGDGDTAAPQVVEATVPSPAPATSVEMPPEAPETAQVATIDAEAAPNAPVQPAEAVVATAAQPTAETADATAEAADMTAEAVNVTAEAVDVAAEPVDMAAEAVDVTAEDSDAAAEDADDEAILEMVALEMAAPDPTDTDSDSDEIHVAELAHAPADAEIIAPRPEPSAALAPSLQPSLGSTLIANGIVRKPTASGPDPLAPIRRMSQAEKIALFS